MQRFSLVGARQWPMWLWSTFTILGPLAYYLGRVTAR